MYHFPFPDFDGLGMKFIAFSFSFLKSGFLDAITICRMNSRNSRYDSRNRSRIESQIRTVLFHLLKLDRHLWKFILQNFVSRNPHMDDLDYQGTFAIMYYYRCAFPGGHTHANVLVDNGSDYSIHDCFDGVLPQSSSHCCHARYVTCNDYIIIVFEFYRSRC